MPIESARVAYSAGSTVMKSFISKPEKAEFSFPGVMVFPEWWGLTEYLELRTKQLAELGYVAMAVDMYGEGKIASDPAEAGSLMNGVLRWLWGRLTSDKSLRLLIFLRKARAERK